jgi:hypothetical protein
VEEREEQERKDRQQRAQDRSLDEGTAVDRAEAARVTRVQRLGELGLGRLRIQRELAKKNKVLWDRPPQYLVFSLAVTCDVWRVTCDLHCTLLLELWLQLANFRLALLRLA